MTRYVSHFTDYITLRKHACSNILKIYNQKQKKIQIENYVFHISAQNRFIEAVLTSTNNLFFSKIGKIMYTSVYASFNIQKWG